jgi:hypothetical protein
VNQLQKKITKNTLLKNEEGGTPFLEWNFKLNGQATEQELESIQLSDGSNLNADTLNKALKKSFGTSDSKTGERILKKAARGLSANTFDQRINEASCMLPALEPQNPTEALLLGQFLALNDSGMKCLSLANKPDQGFYHVERLFALAHKLLSTANQTMQTILKYRSGGQQTLQVVHVHNEGQAIVAQNVSPFPR